ncbi:SCP2 sterol-binding domain-containing protein [Geoglobus acetivorans]|uniref:SCP2 sterol-binding domain-containing protein n=1 Tax=Geoglobus acetivorans TaxID=565033 RepID=A0ABZ3H2T5_GEOAI|nr:SCP2 sterol-binding domain-containing protein [Geoglobus acetivorans]
MPKLFSEEWVKEYMRLLNESEEYAQAAKDWEGDFLFVVEPDEGLTEPMYIYLDLYHGKARDGYMVKDPSQVSAAFEFRGKYSNWKKLLNGEIDPIKGLVTGKFKLRGNMAKVMRYAKAAKALVEVAQKVETELPE